uniref:Uncharacterized protein n=1 Tax=Romanomermis culicivorax TaxID=13658 RepID=A0A915HXQ0_ROMCU
MRDQAILARLYDQWPGPTSLKGVPMQEFLVAVITCHKLKYQSTACNEYEQSVTAMSMNKT